MPNRADRNSKNLPKQILILTVVGFLLFTAVLLLSVDSIRQRLDKQAADDTVQLVENRVEGLREYVRVFSQDYNNWTDMHLAAMSGDIRQLADNYGITAIQGKIFDRAMMYDGPFVEPISWIRNGSKTPGGPILPENVRDEIRRKLSLADPGARPFFDFVDMIDGRLVFFTGARLLPDFEQSVTNRQILEAPIAVIGRRLAYSDLAKIESELGITDLTAVAGPIRPGEIAVVPLLDATGNQVAKLTWTPGQPGTRLIGAISNVLLFVVAAFAVVGAGATMLVHKNARALVDKEREARALARIDVLSDLPNRLAFNEFLASPEARNSAELALLMIDLNNFKNINDLVGHSGGDSVIRELADRLRIFQDRRTFAARIGGDEFVLVICADRDVIERAQRITAELLSMFGSPLHAAGTSFELTLALGLAIRQDQGESPAELVRRADRAMYSAKIEHSTELRIYDETMDLRHQADRLVERSLREAIQTGDGFSVVYQPIVKAGEGTLIRAEALARWESPAVGTIQPTRFVRIAEESGLVSALGWILIDRICLDLAACPTLHVSINVSPLQLMYPDFVEGLMMRLARHNIAPSRIEIELTEGIMVQNPKTISRQINELRRKGVTIALDDYGTGFSSIGYIREMHFDTVKIAGALLSEPGRMTENAAIVQSVISFCKALHKSVVVEGVETADQAELVESYGADLLQGYHIGKPMRLGDLMCRFDLQGRDSLLTSRPALAAPGKVKIPEFTIVA